MYVTNKFDRKNFSLDEYTILIYIYIYMNLNHNIKIIIFSIKKILSIHKNIKIDMFIIILQQSLTYYQEYLNKIKCFNLQ